MICLKKISLTVLFIMVVASCVSNGNISIYQGADTPVSKADTLQAEMPVVVPSVAVPPVAEPPVVAPPVAVKKATEVVKPTTKNKEVIKKESATNTKIANSEPTPTKVSANDQPNIEKNIAVDVVHLPIAVQENLAEPITPPDSAKNIAAEPQNSQSATSGEMHLDTHSILIDSMGRIWMKLEPATGIQPTAKPVEAEFATEELPTKAKRVIAGQKTKSNRFDRGITQNVFVPKGQWLVGGNLSYADYKGDNYGFLILDAIKGDGYTLKLSPFVGYFFKDNMAAGARFAYTRNYYNIGNLDFKLSDDLNFGIQNLSSIQHKYSGAIFLRNYLSLGNSKRFGLFNETRITVGAGQGKLVNGAGETIKGTYQDILDLQLGLAPGIVAFITDNVGVEVSVGVLGLKYNSVKQVTNQVEMGSFTKTSANFKIDLFSINLGIAFYINSMNGLNPFNLRFRRGKQIYDETEFEKSIAL